MPPTQHLSSNGIELAFETFGSDAHPAVLLVMGNSASGVVWPDAFCTQLAGHGFYVVRFDQRDTGLSTYIDFETHPYSLDDLADDAIGLLDALHLEKAHVVGLSLGGVLAYRMALRAPSRVGSLVVMMSSPDLRPKNDAFMAAPVRPGELPRPTAEYVQAVLALNATPPTGEEETAIRFVDNFRLARQSGSPFDEEFWLHLGREVAARSRQRGNGLTVQGANHGNHSRAQIATPPLTTQELASLNLPVLVIHGDGDPIFPLEHASFAAQTISRARFVVIQSMGHALDPAFFTSIIEEMTEFIQG